MKILKKSKSILSVFATILVITSLLIVSQVATPVTVLASHCTTTYSTGSPPPTPLWTISSSGTYCFDAGTYNTQITITANNVVLTGAPGTTASEVIIQPATVIDNAVNPDPGPTPVPAIIYANAVTGVTVEGLTVDGSVAAAAVGASGPCTTDSYGNAPSDGCYFGILFYGASGGVMNSVVNNMNTPTAPSVGMGIQVEHGTSVTISGNTVSNYAKNGITCDGAGVTCTISDNLIYPLSTSGQHEAPNGIEVSSGAVGIVSLNTVSGNECNVPTTCGPNYIYQTQSIGIVLYPPPTGAGTVVRDNTITGNDVGILTYTEAVTPSVALTNNVLQNNRYEGMYLSDGTYTASNNKISGSLVGIALISDGYADNPTTVTLSGNNFMGFTFSTPQVQLVAYTGTGTGAPPAPYGGTYAEPIQLTINGFSETVTAAYLPGTSASTPPTNPPSFVNIP